MAESTLPSLALVVLASAAVAGCGDPTGDIPVCDYCGMIIVEIGAEPFDGGLDVFHVATRAITPDSGVVLGTAVGAEPGAYEVRVGVPWGVAALPGDSMVVWVVAVWHEEPRNEALVDIDSVMARAYLRPRGEAPPESRVTIALKP